MWVLGTLVFGVVAACSLDANTPEEGDGVLGQWVWSGGFQRTYVHRLPGGYDGVQPAPLLLAFHGFPDTGPNFGARSGLTAAADAAGAIVVFPNGIQGSWAAGCRCTTADGLGVDDPRFVRTLIAHLAQHLAIDRTRVYVTGFSEGGMLVHRLSCDLADVIAGAGSVGATMSLDLIDVCRPARRNPMLFVNGTADPVFPWDGAAELGVVGVDSSVAWWRGSNGCSGAPVVTTPPDTADDGTSVVTASWTDCTDGARVGLITVEGGGHTWPGGPGPFGGRLGVVSREIDAGAAVLGFLGLPAAGASTR